MGDSGLQAKANVIGLDGILRNFEREVDVAVSQVKRGAATPTMV